MGEPMTRNMCRLVHPFLRTRPVVCLIGTTEAPTLVGVVTSRIDPCTLLVVIRLPVITTCASPSEPD